MMQWRLAPKCGPRTSISPGSYLEMRNLRLFPIYVEPKICVLTDLCLTDGEVAVEGHI